jgi:hypothetical protein
MMGKKAFVLGTVLSVSLILIGGGTFAAKKPPKTEPVWTVTVPNETSYNVAGIPEHVYRGGEGSVRLMVSKSKDPQVVKTYFQFFVDATPDQNEWLEFRNTVVYDAFTTEDGEPCGFPEGETGACLQDFLLARHPNPGYQHLMFYITITEYLDDLPLNQDFLTNSGFNLISFWNSFICGDETNAFFHTVHARIRSYNCQNGAGVWVMRTGPDSWRIRIERQSYELEETYCLLETVEQPVGRSGKTTTVTSQTNYSPQYGRVDLSYVFDIKREIK